LLGVTEHPGKNAECCDGGKTYFGPWFVVLVLASEAALLFVAAQTGFIDGRV